MTYQKSPYKEAGINARTTVGNNGWHFANGLSHRGKKSQCIICSQKAPGIMGYQGGGVNGIKT